MVFCSANRNWHNSCCDFEWLNESLLSSKIWKSRLEEPHGEEAGESKMKILGNLLTTQTTDTYGKEK